MKNDLEVLTESCRYFDSNTKPILIKTKSLKKDKNPWNFIYKLGDDLR